MNAFKITKSKIIFYIGAIVGIAVLFFAVFYEGSRLSIPSLFIKTLNLSQNQIYSGKSVGLKISGKSVEITDKNAYLIVDLGNDKEDAYQHLNVFASKLSKDIKIAVTATENDGVFDKKNLTKNTLKNGKNTIWLNNGVWKKVRIDFSDAAGAKFEISKIVLTYYYLASPFKFPFFIILAGIFILLWRYFYNNVEISIVYPRISFFKQHYKAFLISLLIALALEFTIFNLPHYASLFGGAQIEALYDKDTKSFNLLSASGGKGQEAQQIKIEIENGEIKDGKYAGNGKIIFSNFEPFKIASVRIKPLFNYKNDEVYRLVWTDVNTERIFDFRVIKNLLLSEYININPNGLVEAFQIEFGQGSAQILEISINKTIPYFFLWFRIILITSLLFLFYLIKKFFFLPFNPKSANQKAAFIILIVFYCFLCFFITYSAFNFRDTGGPYRLLTNAFLNGQTSLLEEPSQELKNARRPYDYKYRATNNIPAFWDFVFYKGKYYVYYTPLPSLLLFAPYKILTGADLPTSGSVCLFSMFFGVCLLLVWRILTQRYMLKMPFVFFMMGGAVLILSNLMPIVMSRPAFYELAIVAALSFSILGIYLLLKAFENQQVFDKMQAQTAISAQISYSKVFFGALCLALAVGCKPTYIIMSIFVFALLPSFEMSYLKQNWKTLAVLFLPYIIVGVPLALYNYVRYGSITEFGITYSLTLDNIIETNNVNPIVFIYKTMHAFIVNLFSPPMLSVSFPFIRLSNNIFSTTYSFLVDQLTIGIFYIPIVWSLFGLKSATARLRGGSARFFKFFAVCFIVPPLFIVLNTFNSGATMPYRFSADWYYLILFASLVTAYFIYEQVSEVSINAGKVCLSILYVLMFLSFTQGLLLTFSGEGQLILRNHSSIYYYLAYCFNTPFIFSFP